MLVYSQHPERECMPGGGGQPFAGAFSKDEIQRERFKFCVNRKN